MLKSILVMAILSSAWAVQAASASGWSCTNQQNQQGLPQVGWDGEFANPQSITVNYSWSDRPHEFQQESRDDSSDPVTIHFVAHFPGSDAGWKVQLRMNSDNTVTLTDTDVFHASWNLNCKQTN